ncbi:hypothetical protein WMF04_41160 [Sorangium sp. So ce260]|uniref:hypothetical protein n=1 Tax=Sorangium sp. So ce260 TaxID=3133291 RepID=UPI003F5E86CC
MGNRHHHKKLRADVRARMARTGESYQKALARILDERSAPAPARGVDLVPIEYFGAPAALATFEIAGRLACLVVSSPHHRRPFPYSPLVAVAMRGPRTVH